jgi:putative ABC transport system substrate-binding protein
VKRRGFIFSIAAVAALWPLAGAAQEPERVRRIGMLMGYAESDPDTQANLAALREALQRLGWAEGHNIRIEMRWAIPADLGSMRRSAKELVALRPDLILSEVTPTTAALLRETRAIPIVFIRVSDPMGSGFVASFPHPGGNVTGFNSIEPTMPTKWLQFLKEIAPGVVRIAVLFNPETAPYAEFFLNPLKTAASSVSVEVIATPVRDISEMESAVAAHAVTPSGGLLALPDSFMDVHRAEITSLAARYRLPAVYPFRQFSDVGGLLSYGNDQVDNYRRVAVYVDRILRGAKPSELPIQAPVKFELVINLRTANALGLTVPPSLLQRADEVIE